MYLTKVRKQNPALLQTVLSLHQSGRLYPNTWVIDLDTIAENAAALSSQAKQLGLKTYIMSKQHNRNPYVNALAMHCGLGKIVAVDAAGAFISNRYGLPIGHVGHLNQIPKHIVPKIVKMKPEVFTIYNLEHAIWINHAANEQNRVQDLLIRVSCKDDIFYDGQEGGFDESDVVELKNALDKLKNIRLVGVTAFPCLTYNETPHDKIEVTPNLHTIVRVANQLTKLGAPITQINAPANTHCAVMPLLKQYGATHVEPGNGLLGTTPSHAFEQNLKEKTAFVYLSEISHRFNQYAYAYGGGCVHTAYGDEINALVGSTWETAQYNAIEYLHTLEQNIDYHMVLAPKKNQPANPGDSVLLSYRTQMHMTRSYVACISGISGSRALKCHYFFDNAGNGLDGDLNPVSKEVIKKDIQALLKTY